MRGTELPFDQDKIPTFFWNREFEVRDTISRFSRHLELSKGIRPLVDFMAWTRLYQVKNDAIFVLASGGLDSTTLIALAKEQGICPQAVFVDYGQPATWAEETAVDQIERKAEIPIGKNPVSAGSVLARAKSRAEMHSYFTWR